MKIPSILLGKHVRKPEACGAAARDDEADRQRREHVLVVLGDVLRRTAPDGVHVDPRDDARDEDDPRHGLEVRQEPPAEKRHRGELREVREHVEACLRQHEREHRERDPDRQEPARAPQRQREPDERERRGDHDESDERDRRPERHLVDVRRDAVPRDERREED